MLKLSRNNEKQRRPFKIEARDIILKNFHDYQEPQPRTALGAATSFSKNKDFVDAYLSTPRFMKTLTDLSDEVMKQPTNKEKLRFLKQQLCEINKRLPAQVYIPFVNKSMRNYAILNIVAEEAIVFKTKERAPLLLALEVYRPTEITIDENFELKSHQEQQQKMQNPKKSQARDGSKRKRDGKQNQTPVLQGGDDEQ